MWTTIKNLTKPQHKQENNVITFNDILVANQSKCAKLFNRQFSEHPSKPNKHMRVTTRKIHQLKNDIDFDEFTDEIVEQAIKKCKNSKAVGPDGISPVMMKKLGPNGIDYPRTYVQFVIT